jgi:DMSO/TMAO reductase YedYZ molybdopterin-dependent catalytic subunit
MSETSETLIVDGAVERPARLSFEDFRAMKPEQQVPDVSRFHPNRCGDAVTLEAILERVAPRPEARYLTLHADRDDFHVSIGLDAVRGEGLIVYKVAEAPMTPKQGGPYRFLIRNPAACHTDDLDDCANVKYLNRMELSAERGLDTRPENEQEHAELHANEQN